MCHSSKPAAALLQPLATSMSAPSVSGLTKLDKGLAFAAAIVSLAALGCVLYLALHLKTLHCKLIRYTN